MGSYQFEERVSGKDIGEAYGAAVEDAQYEHGHDPYNGTISTTHGFIDITSEWKTAIRSGKVDPISEKSVEDWHQDLYDDPRIEKWGKCFGYLLDSGQYYFFGSAAC